MKCFRLVGQGIPTRMSDADARQVVEIDKDGEYCPKSAWKSFHDNNLDERFRRRTSCHLDGSRIIREVTK